MQWGQFLSESRTQASKKKGRKIDVDPAFPPEIRDVSDADLASTSA
jgi:hypothetical protein